MWGVEFCYIRDHGTFWTGIFVKKWHIDGRNLQIYNTPEYLYFLLQLLIMLIKLNLRGRGI